MSPPRTVLKHGPSLLYLLAANAGRVLTCDEILDDLRATDLCSLPKIKQPHDEIVMTRRGLLDRLWMNGDLGPQCAQSASR
jgi:hypothetical protein